MGMQTWLGESRCGIKGSLQELVSEDGGQAGVSARGGHTEWDLNS